MTPTDTATSAGIQDAARHLAEGRAAEAAAVLERLVREFPAYVTAHVLLAKAREAGGRPAEALAAWHDACFLMPSSPLVVRERARLLRAETGAPDPAEAPPPEEVVPPHGEIASPQSETTPPQSEAAATNAEAEPKRSEPSETLGAEPDAWAVDTMAPASAPAEHFDTPDDKDDWTILEETETLRPTSDAVTEPSVAPPPGHRPTRPGGTAPRPKREARDDTPKADDLDTLIEQLENAPRIRPDLAFRDDEAEPGESGEGEVVSETLARIYEAQKQFSEAARAYEQLAAQRPARATELLSKAAEMRQRAAGSGAQG